MTGKPAIRVSARKPRRTLALNRADLLRLRDRCARLPLSASAPSWPGLAAALAFYAATALVMAVTAGGTRHGPPESVEVALAPLPEPARPAAREADCETEPAGAGTDLAHDANDAWSLEIDGLHSNYWSEVYAALTARLRYPAAARRQGIEGHVLARLSIGRTGELHEARACDPTDDIFGRAVLSAVHGGAPYPAPPAGVPVPVTLEIPVSFRLDHRVGDHGRPGIGARRIVPRISESDISAACVAEDLQRGNKASIGSTSLRGSPGNRPCHTGDRRASEDANRFSPGYPTPPHPTTPWKPNMLPDHRVVLRAER